jgi:FtsZ-binding cell division protein ZapB
MRVDGWKDKLDKEIRRFGDEIDQVSTEISEIDRAMEELGRRAESLKQARRIARDHLDRLRAIRREGDEVASPVDAQTEYRTPPGPPVGELIIRTLADAGSHGMKVSELLVAIAERRPDVQTNSISSVLSKLKRAGKVISINGKYTAQKSLSDRLSEIGR